MKQALGQRVPSRACRLVGEEDEKMSIHKTLWWVWWEKNTKDILGARKKAQFFPEGREGFTKDKSLLGTHERGEGIPIKEMTCYRAKEVWESEAHYLVAYVTLTRGTSRCLVEMALQWEETGATEWLLFLFVCLCSTVMKRCPNRLSIE